MNDSIRKLLCSGVSQRRIASVLNLNRKTVVRKFLFLFAKARPEIPNDLVCSAIEFDDLETIEHTKCKPLSVTLAVEHKTRRILGIEVSRMPAKGLIAKLARKKYGPRIDERATGRQRLFTEIQKFVAPDAVIKSDQNPHYTMDVQKFFPGCSHQTVKGARGSVGGQGELKKIKFDPLFSLNHTCAMLRADINRLIRRTWCTTKKPERLSAHLKIYQEFHNQKINLAY
jgi:hypothetical protein